MCPLDTFRKHWERFEAERLAGISVDAGDRAELGLICTNVQAGPVHARSGPIRTYADYLERPTSAPTTSLGDRSPSVATASAASTSKQDTRGVDVRELCSFDTRLVAVRSDVDLRQLDDAAATQSGESNTPSVPLQAREKSLPEIHSVEAASRSAEWWQTMLSDDFFDETAASLRD